jgi:hypothetical protein
MSVWFPAQAEHSVQLAELCQHTRAYFRAPGLMRRSVPSVPSLVSHSTMRQGWLVVALSSSPVCCIKCWCVRQVLSVKNLSHT